MFDAAQSFRLTDARIVTPDAVFEGSLDVQDGLIAGTASGGAGLSLGGDYLIPGIVDVHTDHVETHVIPRSSVQWTFPEALSAHDAVVISGGTTTVFDSISVGASLKNPERREILAPLVTALETMVAEDALRARHILHMRCEICDPDTIRLVDEIIGKDIAQLVSVMDHTPGDRQSPDVARWTANMARNMGMTMEDAVKARDELLDRSARVSADVRDHVVAAAHAHNLPLMSHDDRTVEQVDQALAEGVTVSEFPTTLEAAHHARKNGLGIVAGAPNYLRGGSQSGNVSVHALLAEGLVDILASDYVPRSPLDAAFAIAEDPSLPQSLVDTIAMVSTRPAALCGLSDRGALVSGLAADMVQVRRQNGRNRVVAVWRDGRRVF